MLQQQVVKSFPLKNGKVTLRDPKVLLAEGSDRIGLEVGYTVPILGGIKANGSVTGDGRLRYDTNTGTLYLDNPAIKVFKIQGISSGLTNGVRQMVTPVLQQALPQVPLYQLDTNEIQGRLARKTLRAVRVSDGRVEVTFGL
jgi:hypothetical protein